MTARRHSPLLSVACLVIGALLLREVLDASFVAPQRAAAARGRVARSSYESGRINLDAELGESKSLPVPVLEASEATNRAIMDCIEEGCSVDAIMELDGKLARDEQKIQASIEAVKTAQKTAYSEENVAALVWFDNFLQRAGGLRAQLQALKGTPQDTDFVKQLVKAASVAFGGGRETDYPKVGVSPYSA
mmetsp:Transcript_139037/g.352470  ORF Transcript_139037/g.352470 Transcript_139037/m.352470 type:complete len:190 (+) Transcript_139037:48-617(+)